MAITLADLATLDYPSMGSPFFEVSASTSISTSSLDTPSMGEPFYGLEASVPGAPDTALSAEFTVVLTTDAPLTTGISLAGDFTVELTVADTFMNLGSTAKMEIVF